MGRRLYFYYSIYYCSQATFQLGDNYWSVFKPKMHEVLLQSEVERLLGWGRLR